MHLGLRYYVGDVVVVVVVGPNKDFFRHIVRSKDCYYE